MLPFPKSEGLMYMYKSMVSIGTKLDIYSDSFIKLFLKKCLLSSQGFYSLIYGQKNISGILCELNKLFPYNGFYNVYNMFYSFD